MTIGLLNPYAPGSRGHYLGRLIILAWALGSLPFPAPAPAQTHSPVPDIARQAGGNGITFSVDDPSNPDGVWRIERSIDLNRWASIRLARATDGRLVHEAARVPFENPVLYRATAEPSPPPAVRFDQPCELIREAEAVVRLKVMREGDTSAATNVFYATADLDAANGLDFVAQSGLIEFAPGMREQWIEIPLRADETPEEDERFLVGLASEVGADLEDWDDAVLVTILDDDGPIITSAACLEFIPEWLSFSPRPFELFVDGDALVWSEAGESPLRALSLSGTPSIRSLAQRMEFPESFIIQDDIIYRVESRAGAGRSGCVGQGLHSALIRTALDGSDPQLMIDFDTCSGTTRDFIVDPYFAFVVTSTASPPRFEILRVPLDHSDSEAEALVSTGGEIKAIASDGAFVYWVEEVDVANGLRNQIYRIPRLGGDPLEMGEPFVDFMGNLEIAYGKVYAAGRGDGQVKLVSIDTITDLTKTLWTNDTMFATKRIVKLAAHGDLLYWLDDDSLNRIPLAGGSVETLAAGLPFPGDFCLKDEVLYWSESESNGAIKRLDLGRLEAPVRLTGATYPSTLAATDETLYWIEANRFAPPTGFGRIASMPLLNSAPVTTAVTGISEDTPPFVVGEDAYFLADQWTIRRVPKSGGNAEILATGASRVTTLATDGAFVYWIEADSLNPVKRVAVSGGDAEFLGTGTGSPNPHSLHAHGDQLYWVDHDTRIVALPKAGGALRLLADGGDFISDLVLHGEQFFYALSSSGDLMRVPLVGGTPVPFGSSQGSTWTRLLATPTHLLRLHQTGLDRIDFATGAVNPILVQDMAQDAFFAGALAAGQGRIYWTEPQTGRIRSIGFR